MFIRIYPPEDHKEAIKPDNFVPIIVPTDHFASKMILYRVWLILGGILAIVMKGLIFHSQFQQIKIKENNDARDF